MLLTLYFVLLLVPLRLESKSLESIEFPDLSLAEGSQNEDIQCLLCPTDCPFFEEKSRPSRGGVLPVPLFPWNIENLIFYYYYVPCSPISSLFPCYPQNLAFVPFPQNPSEGLKVQIKDLVPSDLKMINKPKRIKFNTKRSPLLINSVIRTRFDDRTKNQTSITFISWLNMQILFLMVTGKGDDLAENWNMRFSKMFYIK